MDDGMMMRYDLPVTLQIPGEKLSPNNMTGVYIEEPSVLVKSHSEGSQTWTMDKLNCRLDDMVSGCFLLIMFILLTPLCIT